MKIEEVIKRRWYLLETSMTLAGARQLFIAVGREWYEVWLAGQIVTATACPKAAVDSYNELENVSDYVFSIAFYSRWDAKLKT